MRDSYKAWLVLQNFPTRRDVSDVVISEGSETGDVILVSSGLKNYSESGGLVDDARDEDSVEEKKKQVPRWSRSCKNS